MMKENKNVIHFEGERERERLLLFYKQNNFIIIITRTYKQNVNV